MIDWRIQAPCTTPTATATGAPPAAPPAPPAHPQVLRVCPVPQAPGEVSCRQWQVILPPLDLPEGYQPPAPGQGKVAYLVSLDMLAIQPGAPSRTTVEDQWEALLRQEATVVVTLYMFHYLLY